MTMLLGYNFGDKAYITADTRATYPDGRYKDEFQKIEILKDRKLVLAFAGSANLASLIMSELARGIITFPSSPNLLFREVKPIIKRYLASKWKDIIKNSHILDAIFLFEDFSGKEITMGSYHISFYGFDIGKVKIRRQFVKSNEFVKIGAIYEPKPVKKAPITDSPLLKSKTKIEVDALENYFSVTNEMFNLAKKLDKKGFIGGKTTTVITYKYGNRFLFRGVKGLRSITHSDEEFQDVSDYTDLDNKSGNFYLRDIRNDGKIVSHIEKRGSNYIFHYDSCPLNSGKKDLSEAEMGKLVFCI